MGNENSRSFVKHTVFPEPLKPTIKVRGEKNCMTSAFLLLNERTLIGDEYAW